MSLVRLGSIEELSEEGRRVAESGQHQYGKLLNTWRVLFNAPKIFENYMPYLRSIVGPGSTPHRYKEISALYVGWLNQCRYTVCHRSTSAQKNGVSELEIVALVKREWELFEPQLIAILELTERLTLDATLIPNFRQPGLISEGLKERLKAFYSDEQIVEFVSSIALWNALARFHRVMELDDDMPSPPTPLINYFNTGKFD